MRLLAVCISIFSIQALANVNIPVTKYKLANGLTVILHEDHSTPLISYNTWFRVGSRDEDPTVTGVAHMLEHMMFKGAKKYTGKEFDKILHENGVTNNAFTTHDYTGYYENLPSSKLELIMDMESDRMTSLALKDSDLQSEKQVVSEERRWRVDNNPYGLMEESMFDNLFSIGSPYKWPVLGYMKDIQAYVVPPLKDFYTKYYAPNNAILVIAGDFDTEKTKKLIEKYYGALEPKTITKKDFSKDPGLTAPIYKELPGNVQTESIIVGFKAADVYNKDNFAMDFLSDILGSGSSSRLYKKLVYETQLASAVTAYNWDLMASGVFVVQVYSRPGADRKKIIDIVNQEIRSLRDKVITTGELEKVKNQVQKEHIDQLATIVGKANALAANETIYSDYQKLFTNLELYKKVTQADINKVAKKYLDPNKQLTLILIPKK